MKVSTKGIFIEQLAQLTQLTWDGDLISKPDRDALVKCGYAYRINGFNFITENGIIVLQNLNVLKM